MKAKMKNGLTDLYLENMPEEFDEEVRDFLNTIDGKEVELVFIGKDAFEKEDNNFWLPEFLWDEIK